MAKNIILQTSDPDKFVSIDARKVVKLSPVIDDSPLGMFTTTTIILKPDDFIVTNEHPWIVANALDWALDTRDFTPALRRQCDSIINGEFGYPWEH